MDNVQYFQNTKKLNTFLKKNSQKREHFIEHHKIIIKWEMIEKKQK